MNEAVRRTEQSVRGSLRVRILTGAGHRPPVTAGHLDAVADLAHDPAAATDRREVVGAEPTSRRGVPTLPSYRWFLDPRLHLAVTVTAAALAGTVSPRPRTRPRLQTRTRLQIRTRLQTRTRTRRS